MEGRFAGRTWKLAGIAKFVLQLGQQSKTREETKNMLSQMNYRKETQTAEHSRFRDRPAEYRAGVLPLA